MHFTTLKSGQIIPQQQQQQQQHHQEQQTPQIPIKMSNYSSNNKGRRARISSTSIAILICLLACGLAKTNAVPTDSVAVGGLEGPVALRPLTLHWHRVVRREVPTLSAMVPPTMPLAPASLVQEEPAMHKDATTTATGAGTAETMLVDQPQGLCLLDGVLVAETSVFCEKQRGCRAIQRTGHCCPDYQCDCEKDGKTYSNGDKLVDPENPCTVCYCQGGEILCSSVTCFQRDDCTPKYIPGRCCPEYDNCPVSPVANGQANKTLSSPTSQNRSEMAAAAALNPKITIKEITKPIEIRITDDNKAIPIHQMLKPTTTTTTSTPPTTTTTLMNPMSTTTTTTEAPASSTAAITVLNSSASSSASASVSAPAEDVSPTWSLASTKASPTTKAGGSWDTNQPAKASPSSAVGINGGGSLKLTASVAYPSTEHPSLIDGIDGDRTLSSLFERAEEGDGDAVQQVTGEREAGSDPSKVNKREYLLSTEDGGVLSEELGISPEVAYPSLVPQGGVLQSGQLQQSTAELGEPETAGSDNIYHIIMTTDGPRGSSITENYLAVKGSTEGMGPEPAFDNANNPNASRETQSTTEGPYNPTTDDSRPSPPTAQSTTEAVDLHQLKVNQPGTSTAEPNSSTTESLHHMDEDDGTIPVESNPAYPSLPEDDFSLRDVTFPLGETDDIGETDLKDEPRSIGGAFDPMKSTKHLDHHDGVKHAVIEGSGSDMEVGTTTASSSTADFGSGIGRSTTDQTIVAMPEKIELMYSAEDLSEETKISNSTDFRAQQNIMREPDNDMGSGDSIEMRADDTLGGDLLGSGSGSGELMVGMSTAAARKQREPTTPRPTRKPAADIDIDELGTASGDGTATNPLDDPKLDVESLKIDDTQGAGLVKLDPAVDKGSVLTIKPHPAEDKTFEAMIEGLQHMFFEQ